jgi:hypothetical protein
MIIDQLFAQPIFESQTDPITQFASNAHEEWRRNFDPTGTKPRIKKNSDGTEGDINVPFEKLHPDWKKENLAAGHAAHHAVKHFGNNMEKAAEHVHNEWMKRNPKADYNAAQHVPYDDLSDDEKEKDRVHVRTMMRLMGHQLNEFAPSGDDGEGPDQEEILRRLAAHWWNGNEHQMARAEHTLAAMGWEIGEDDGYDEGGVFVVRPGDEHGRTYTSWSADELDMNEAAPPGAKAERMVKHIKQGYARDGKLTPKEKGIAFATAWKAHNAGQVEEGEITKNATGLKHRATDKYGAGDDEPHHYTGGRSGFSEPGKYARDLEHVNKQLVKDLDASMGISWKNRGPKGLEVDEQGVAEGKGLAKKVRKTLNAWMEQDQQYEDPTQRAGFQAKVWPYIQENIRTILADKGEDGKGSYPASPFAAWLLVQHMDAYPQNQGEFLQQLAQSGLNPTDGKGGEGKLQFLKDRYEVNKWIAANANNKEYFINNEPLPNPTVNVRNPAMFKDAGQVATSRKEALTNAEQAGNKLLVAAVNATKAKTQPSYKQGVEEGLTEMDKSEPSAGRDTGPREGPEKIAKPITKEKMVKHALDTLSKSMAKKDDKKKDVKESNTLMIKLKRALVREGRVKELADDLKTMSDTDFMKKYGKAKAAIRKEMNRVDEAPINELSTNKLAQYKTAAAKDAKAADQAGDFKRGDKRLSGMVQATKKQFDNDAKKVDESRAARRALMAQIVNGN